MGWQLNHKKHFAVVPRDEVPRAAVPIGGVRRNFHFAARASRLYHGILTRVAAEMGVSPSYVSRVARGERRSLRVQRALARALGRVQIRLGAPHPR